MARRALLDEAGLRFLPGWYEDSSFSHPMMMAARSIDVLHEVCYCYRQRTPGGITTTVSARHFEVFDQYERLFAIVDRASGAYDVFRPELFRLMINHYLVIVGNEWRLPTGMHRAFFRRIAQDYRRWLPAGGYAVPDGVTGLKHRLVRHDAYRAYAALRLAHRQTAGVRRLLSLGEARRVGRAARAVPAPRSVMPGTSKISRDGRSRRSNGAWCPDRGARRRGSPPATGEDEAHRGNQDRARPVPVHLGRTAWSRPAKAEGPRRHRCATPAAVRAGQGLDR